MSRLAPFSLRLTPEERSQLESQAGAMPLASYIKSVVFAADPRRGGPMAGVMAKPKKAVIYARVSGAKQVREGDGLASQENRCREYATYKDYDVIEVFKDDMSGKFERRPAMDRMLAFLRLHPKGSVVVIIDDISRFARDVQAHISLRQTLAG